MAATGRRQYRSPLRERRAEETRAGLREAARRLFEARGWAGTGMRDVAAEAGVSTETVYAYFPSKRALLQAVIDVAAGGDDQPVRVAERPEFAALGRGRRADRIAAAAGLLAAVNARTAPIAVVLREAAPTDEEIAEVLRATRERQRADVAAGLELILGRRATAQERDGVWAIGSPDVHQLLVEGSGWSPEQYATWMTETLERVIPRA